MQLLLTMIGHTSWVQAVAVSPDGCFVFSGGDDKTLTQWDVLSGAVRAHTAAWPGERARAGSRDPWLQPVRIAHESSGILGLRTIPGAVLTFCADKAVREWRDGEVRAGQRRALQCWEAHRERDGPQLVRTVSAAEAASLVPPGLGLDRQDRGLLHVRA